MYLAFCWRLNIFFLSFFLSSVCCTSFTLMLHIWIAHTHTHCLLLLTKVQQIQIAFGLVLFARSFILLLVQFFLALPFSLSVPQYHVCIQYTYKVCALRMLSIPCATSNFFSDMKITQRVCMCVCARVCARKRTPALLPIQFMNCYLYDIVIYIFIMLIH